jgi:hypothetical protein
MARLIAATSDCNECVTSTGIDAKCLRECATRTMPDLPSVQQKQESCRNLEWLPFGSVRWDARSSQPLGGTTCGEQR